MISVCVTPTIVVNASVVTNSFLNANCRKVWKTVMKPNSGCRAFGFGTGSESCGMVERVAKIDHSIATVARAPAKMANPARYQN